MESDNRRILARVRKALQRRRWLAALVDALLWGGGALVAGVFALQFGVCPLRVAVGGAAVLALSVFALRLRRCRVSLLDAGLHLDLVFSLKERMSAVASLEQGRHVPSRFATLLRADALSSLRAAGAEDFSPKLVPPRASYLSLPAAAVAVLLLLGPMVGAGSGGGDSRNPTQDAEAAPLAAAADEPSPVGGGRLQRILARLREANARLRRGADAAELEEVRRLQRELYRELARLRRRHRAARQGGSRRPGAGGRGAPEAVAVKSRVAPAPGGGRPVAVRGRGPEAGPRWDALVLVEEAVPARMRAGVLAYMNALTAGGEGEQR